MGRIKTLMWSESGASTVEYALLVMLMVMVSLLVVAALGQKTGLLIGSSEEQVHHLPVNQVPVS